jgi:uncharacterized membrane protein YcaP (DUF421 family)
MSDIVIYIVRPIVAFAILLITARILGKQTISRMTFFDFVSAITMGAMTSNIALNTSLSAFHLILSFVMFSLVAFLTAYISLKSQKARKILAGDPTVVIQNGKILEHNMRKMRFTLDYLSEELRERNIFRIEEVLFAILEINGTLTVLKKPQYRSVTKKDLWIAANYEKRLSIELIMDGKVMNNNLQENNITLNWLQTELYKQSLKIEDVVYAVLGPNGELYIDTYNDHLQSPVDLE